MELKKNNNSISADLASKSTLKVRPTKVTHIYQNDKFLKSIPKTSEPKNVLVLYLHNNYIEKLDNLETLYNLTHLYLQWNKISAIDNLDCLRNLKKLYLGYNNITVLEKLEGLKKLKELHIEKQNAETGETICFDPRCLEALGPRLSVLNISGNQLKDLSDIPYLYNLSVLVARDNDFRHFEPVADCVSRLMNLTSVDFTGSPMCSKHRYKETMIAKCFKLETIDGHSVPDPTRVFLKCLDEKRASVQSLRQAAAANAVSEDSLFSAPAAESPNTHLELVEAKRLAASKARELRIKQLDCSGGQVPRCFWRNKVSDRSKAAEDQVPDSTKLDGLEITQELWP